MRSLRSYAKAGSRLPATKTAKSSFGQPKWCNDGRAGRHRDAAPPCSRSAGRSGPTKKRPRCTAARTSSLNVSFVIRYAGLTWCEVRVAISLLGARAARVRSACELAPSAEEWLMEQVEFDERMYYPRQLRDGHWRFMLWPPAFMTCEDKGCGEADGWR